MFALLLYYCLQQGHHRRNVNLIPPGNDRGGDDQIARGSDRRYGGTRSRAVKYFPEERGQAVYPRRVSLMKDSPHVR